MPTISTVPFHSPSLPTISHLPVTVMGAFALVAVVLLVLVAGLAVVVAGLFEFAVPGVVLLPQEMSKALRMTSAKKIRPFLKVMILPLIAYLIWRAV